MSGKQAKKLRRLYKRDLGKQAEAQAKEIEERIKKYSEELSVLLKPAPKWIPDFIWVSLQKIFLNI